MTPKKLFTSFLCVNFFILTTLVCFVVSFPSGAPFYACRNLIPGHSNGSQTSPPPYRVEVSNAVLGAGERTKVSVVGTGDFPFLGFICAASDSNDINNVTVGTMAHTTGFLERDLLKPITCSRSDPDTAMTHTSLRDKYRVEFDWSSPIDAIPGQGFKIRCTVVQSFFRCWTGIQVDLTIGQSSAPAGSGTGNRMGSSDTVSGNNIIPNNAVIVPPQFSNTQPTNTDGNGFSPSTNSNPNQIFDVPPPTLTQSQDFVLTAIDPIQQGIQPFTTSEPSGMSSFTDPQNQFLSPSTQTTSNGFTQPPNQENNMVSRGNEILLPTQNVDLAFLIELINMGFNPFQDPGFNFDPISNLGINVNRIDQGRSFDQLSNPTGPIAFPGQNSMTFQNQQMTNSNGDSPRNRAIPRRGQNSRGLFQSIPRPFNRNFSRIRQSRIVGQLRSNNI